MTTPAPEALASARLRVLPWYPVALAATYVLNLWIAFGISIFAITRGLLVAVAVAITLILIGTAITRSRHAGAAVATVVLAVLLSRGLEYLLGALVLAVAVPLTLILWGRIRHQRLTWESFTRALNIFSGVALIVVLAGGFPRGTYAAVDGDLRQGSDSLAAETPPVDSASATPDIYVLMLDGYPGTDSYERLFGGDNRAFEQELESRGLSVSSESRSNYIFTQLTLTSMFQMNSLSDIEALRPAVAGHVTTNPLMRTLLNENPVFEFLGEHGYRTIATSSGYEETAVREADVFLDSGQINEFEYQLLRFTTIQRLVNLVAPTFFADQHRERVRSAFAQFREIADHAGPPTLAFIHVPSPHLPVVFDEDGDRADLPPSEDIYRWDTIDEATREAYKGQLAYLNGQTLDAIDYALDSRSEGEEPIIIVMSDHGAAPRPAVFVGEGTPDHYDNFFAAYTPGAAGLFPDDVSPVNLFPILLNHYAGGSFAVLPNGPYPWLALK